LALFVVSNVGKKGIEAHHVFVFDLCQKHALGQCFVEFIGVGHVDLFQADGGVLLKIF
jgi:hypothetical protein